MQVAPITRSAWPPLAFGTVIVAAWQVLVATGSLPSAVAAPTAIWAEFVEKRNGLWAHVESTLLSALEGFGYAILAAFTLALMTVVVPRSTAAVTSVAVITYSVPLIALTPVLMVWMGNGPALRTTIAAIASFFPVAVGCIQGFKAVEPARLELFQQLSATRWQQFWRLVVPESLPYVFSGLKIGAAAAVLGAIISEWSGASTGLGRAMIAALASYNPPGVWLTMIAAAALTIALYSAVGLAERVLIRWEFDRDAVAARS